MMGWSGMTVKLIGMAIVAPSALLTSIVKLPEGVESSVAPTV